MGSGDCLRKTGDCRENGQHPGDQENLRLHRFVLREALVYSRSFAAMLRARFKLKAI
jgi:hypothetical protein